MGEHYYLPSRVQGGTTAKIKHLKHFDDIGEPRFLQWREFTGDGSRIF